MPRGPRLDAPGCVHHVLVRGIERRSIFRDDHDRRDLLDRLATILPECGAHCYAWALMPNHVHLVLRTGPVPLARIMARLNTGYATAFNRRHDRVGHLFQNRYKSLLVEDEAHLLTLVCYVHLNPLRGGQLTSLADLGRYRWTGHASLLGHLPVPFQETRAVLDLLGRSPTEARRRLLERMTAVAAAPLAASLPSGVRERESEEAEPLPAGPRRFSGAADLEGLIAAVCSARGIPRALLTSRLRSRPLAAARAEIAYRACTELGLPGARVAKALGLTKGGITHARSRAP